jgi:dihydropyrimidinase
MNIPTTPSTFDLVIKNGVLVSADAVSRAEIGIDGEKIVAIGENLTGRRVLDADGKYVIPGAVDVHVHLEMPIGAFTSTDDFYQGTRAAAFGGTTAVIDFVETGPDETMLQALAKRRAKADKKVAIDYSLHMTIGPHDIARLEQVREARAAGCGSFKLYMAYGLRLTDGELLQAMEAVRDAGGLPVIHAENWDLITTLVRRNLAAGRTTPDWHPRSRPASFEAEAAGRAIDIAMYAGTPLYIFHVSCRATADRIAAAKAAGQPITGETCPQYLYLTEDAYDRPGIDGALPVCSPPLRPETDRQALWQSIANGTLDVVSTDHCPFTREEKATGLEDFSRIPGGVPSIESRLALVFHGLMNLSRDQTALRRWVDICCTTPAELLGLSRKGRLLPGYDADIVLFDPAVEYQIAPDTLHETAGWTPYDGTNIKGRVVTTLSRGEVIVHNGEWLGRAGRGQFIPR